MNAFADARRRLAQSEDRHITDWDMSCLLGVARSTVSRLMHADDEEIRPALILTVEYAIDHGLDDADRIIDTPSSRFQTMLDELPLTYSQVAHLLGIDASWLRKLRKLNADVPRRYYLAVKRLHDRLACTWYHELVEHADAFDG